MDKRFIVRYYDKTLRRYIPYRAVFMQIQSAMKPGSEYKDGIDGVDMGSNDENVVTEQCLGIPDKNNQLICEGDRVSVTSSVDPFLPPGKGFVKWESFAWCVELSNGWTLPVSCLIELGSVFEVIGNIHEVE